jgi:uncharacterized membrane protein YkoI
MRFTKIIQSTALAALVTLGAQGVALAETSALNPSKIATFTNAPTSLIQAIKIAEKQNGGKVFRIDAQSKNGSVYYSISSINDGKTNFMTLDPANGRILSTKTRNFGERLFKREFASALLPRRGRGNEVGEMSGRLEALHTGLVKAVQRAEHQVGGPAIDARIKKQDSSVIIIQVGVVKNGIVKKVFINGVTNNVITAAVMQSEQHRDSEDN